MATFEFELGGLKRPVDVTAVVEHVEFMRNYRSWLVRERLRPHGADPPAEIRAIAERRSQFEVEELTTGVLRDVNAHLLPQKAHALERLAAIHGKMLEIGLETNQTRTFELLTAEALPLIKERDTLTEDLRSMPLVAGRETIDAAAAHVQRLREYVAETTAERRLLTDIEALRTPTGKVDPDARARLLAKVPEAKLNTADEDTFPAQVHQYAADKLGYRREAIEVREVKPPPGGGQVGVSGAKVFLVRAKTQGGETVTVAAVKVFKAEAEHVQEFARELSALERYSHEQHPHDVAVRRLATGWTAKGEGVLIMSGAAGRSIDSMMVALARREMSLDEVRVACEKNGEALARIHTATAVTTASSSAVTAGFVKDFNEVFVRLEGLAEKYPLLTRSVDLVAARRHAAELIAGYQRNPGVGTVVHGDYHPGNVFYDAAADGRITMIDVARAHEAIDATGAGIGSAARDAATFIEALKIFGTEYNVSARDIAQLQASFLRSYSAGVNGNVFTPEAFAFHRARYALRQFEAALTKDPNWKRFTGSIVEFKKDFGVQ